MTVITDPFRTSPTLSEDGFVTVLRERGSFAVDALWAPFDPNEREDAARAIYSIIAAAGHDPGRWLAIAGKEHTWGTNPDSVLWRGKTRSWTNARSVRKPGLKVEKYDTDPVRSGTYIRYANVVDSVLDGLYRIDDPTYAYAGKVSMLDIITIWAPGEDGNRPREYAQTMCEWIDAWAARFPVRKEPAMGLIDLIGQRIAAHGREVHNLINRMPTNGSYDRYSGNNPTHTAVHYTAVNRVADSLEAEAQSWIGHARYHVSNQGWPGIAYTIGISPSGRVFLLGDAERWRFHVFNDNPRAFPVSNDLGPNQEPTPAMLESLRVVLTVLHTETPEFPNLHRGTTYGHLEFASIGDSRNQTSCPGKLLPFVQAYRAGEIATPPPATPDERTDPVTGKKIVHGFLGYYRWLENHLGADEALLLIGRPLTDEYTRDDGLRVQEFERARFEWHPGTRPDRYDVLLGRVNAEKLEATP